jgi:lysophospholipase L1-like esterase
MPARQAGASGARPLPEIRTCYPLAVTIRSPAALLGLTALMGAARLAGAQPATGQPAPFYLHSGDRVVFYGDSITDARLYTTFVETFVLTRFPAFDVRFVHSGWGGDRVEGGMGGRFDRRLERDVLAHRPTVVTVMLGMNDGRYRPYQPALYQRFVAGYELLIRTLKADLPRARITVMQPSPYDEVTRPPPAEGSYNEVLLRFGAFVRQLAARERLQWADLNTDLLRVLTRSQARDPQAAARLVPDRVHPAPAGHLVLAGSLLKAWHAPPLVASLELDAVRGRVVQSRNALVYEITREDGGLRWSEVDAALPMPMDTSDPLVELALASSSLLETLNQQPLKVTGLGEGPYALRIDDRQVGVFRGAQLARGINLATLPTPMARQAADVHALTLKHNDIHFTRWRHLQLALDQDAVQRAPAALEALDGVEQELVDRQHATARPRLRRFALVPVPATAANVPAGFVPVDGGDLRRVLLGGERHKDLEVFLEVDGADPGAAATLLLRLENDGAAYRIALDPREEGVFGRVDAVGIPGVLGSSAPGWREHWRKGEWNAVRARIEGNAPHVTVWLNRTLIVDWTDRSGHVPDPETDGWGYAAIELPSGADPIHPLRFRNVALRPLR